MSVDIQPAELCFRRPFDHEISTKLKLINTNTYPIAFKVKTTAPKQYCVRPNSGIIQPNSLVEVEVLLQAMREDPRHDAKCGDKFLVQSIAVSEQSSLAALWELIGKTTKGSIHERKVRVQYLLASGAASNRAVSWLDPPNAPEDPGPLEGTTQASTASTAVTTTSEAVPVPTTNTSFDLENPGSAKELMWKLRQSQHDCVSFALALLKSRDLDEEYDDDTILARLPSKNLSRLAVDRLLQSDLFERRSQKTLKRKFNDGGDEQEQMKTKTEEVEREQEKIKIEED